jgi:hypothetical protein
LTLARDRYFHTGLAGSFLIHAIALVLIVWGFSTEAGLRLLEPAEPEVIKEEPEVAMIYPEQIIPEPPAPKPPSKAFIRTTQNEAAVEAPKNAAFQSDRNTIAASKLPSKADATLMMPTTEGKAPTTRELANRDYRDGQIKNDAAFKTPATPPDTRQSQPTPPPSPVRSSPPAQPAVPPTPAREPPKQVAQVTPNDATPLVKMMEEMDKNTARSEKDRLPIEVRTAEKFTEMPPVKPQIRAPEDVPPTIPKAVPVPDPVTQMAGKPEADAFTPFTRTGKMDGAVNREGENAVDAEATPLGIYMRQVTGAVEKKWHLYVRLAKDSVTFGRVRFRFYVDKRGVPQDLKILSDARDADPRMRDLTLRAILDAKIPPIPEDLQPTLDDGRVKIEYEAIVY